MHGISSPRDKPAGNELRIFVADDRASELAKLRALLAQERLVLVDGGAECQGWREDLAHETRRADALVVPLTGSTAAQTALVRALRRARPALPLLVLARDKAALVDLYKAGIDDHVVTPVDAGELVCRLEALVRRRFGWASPVVRTGALVVPLDGQAASFAGKPLDLERRLLGTLVCLARHAGRIVTRDTLHTALYDDRCLIGTDTIKVHVCRLRAKLAAAGADGSMIETVPDRGYRLRQDPVIELDPSASAPTPLRA